VAAAVLSLLLGWALSERLGHERASVFVSNSGASPLGVSSHRELVSVPVEAQGPISAALGANDRAYRIGASGSGFQAKSPVQRLHARFGHSGVALSSGAFKLGLSLRAIGYGTSLSTLGDVRPSAKNNRVSYARPGLVEWYANGPLGLEQGFTIARAPSREAAGALTLSLALSGDAHASLSGGGHTITFSHAGSTLRYTGLTATDATGRALSSWLELDSGHLKLRVDTRRAHYPVAIDPLIQQGEKLTTSDGSKGLAGFSVALSGDGNTALIGAPRDNSFAGAALVFTRSGSTWTQQASLVGTEPSGEPSEAQCAEAEAPEEDETGCGFGSSVALSADGNTALIGGPGDGGHVGAAWAFTRSGVGKEATWSQQGSKLVGDCTSSCSGPNGTGETGNGRFGRSVALSADGNTALIGGPLDKLGAAWVFTRSGSSWSQQGAKLSSGERTSHYFGFSIALSADGNAALIGDPGNAGYIGAAWAFTRASSTWTQQGSKLTGAGEESGEGRFGFSVALSADASTALVGARYDNEGAGAAWVFTRSGLSWIQQGKKLTGGSEATGQAKFGWSVALSAGGETALIGAPGDSSHHGGAWLFTRSGAAWAQQDGKLTGGGEEGLGKFGQTVALSASGETALIGGPADNGTVGAAWAFSEQAAVTGVTPTEGPPSGGTTVTISGSNFGEASAVRFGNNGAASFTVNSANSITAVSPPGKGIVDVTVETPGGPGGPSPTDKFTYRSLGGRGVRPTITGTSPGEGPTAGETIVTISGTSLSAATAVEFGSTGAAGFRVISATEIAALSPPRPPGTVDLTVTTPAGTSLLTPADRFTFADTPPTLSSGGLMGSKTPSGGVLGLGPFLVSSCTVALRGKTIAVQSYKRASVKLSWVGVGTCNGRLKLTVKRKISHPKRGHKRFTIKTIGTGTFSIAPGAVRTVRVSLNSLGRALLKARHGRLNASIAITKLAPGPVQARTASVRLALQKPRKTAKHKK
jgi:hypothetical protein